MIEDIMITPLHKSDEIPIIIGIATFESRDESLKEMLKSIAKQTVKPTAIHVYDNRINPDITDLGKFRYLENYKDIDCYYFSMDDDIAYPPTYISDMIAEIDRHGCICTHAGLVLMGTGYNFYRDHIKSRCLDHVIENKRLDVAGTGVTAFRTSYFCPREIYKSPDMKMSDVIFSLEAVIQGKYIKLVTHSIDYFEIIPTDTNTSCFGTQRDSCSRQGDIADEIYALRNGVWFQEL